MALSDIFKSLGDDNRIRILNLLLEEELCVCEIELILNISQSNASRHLNKLKSNKIITYSKEAQWVFYRIDEDFKKEHSLLYEYLKEKCSTNSNYTQDIVRLKKYKNSCYSCDDIGNKQDEIIELICK